MFVISTPKGIKRISEDRGIWYYSRRNKVWIKVSRKDKPSMLEETKPKNVPIFKTPKE